jgi:hypothetical protein
MLRSSEKSVVTRHMRRASVLIALAFTVALVVPAAAGAAGVNVYKKGLVSVSDLPAGWTASTADTTNDDDAATAIAECVGKPVVKKKKVLVGDDIEDSTGTFMVASSVAVYPSATVAKQQFKVYQSSKYAECAKKYFETTPFGEGGPLPTAVITDEVDLDSYGDRSVAYAAQAVIPNADGTELQVTSIQAAVLRGKAIARYQFNSVGDEVFDQETGEELLATLDKRLDKAKL